MGIYYNKMKFSAKRHRVGSGADSEVTYVFIQKLSGVHVASIDSVYSSAYAGKSQANSTRRKRTMLNHLAMLTRSAALLGLAFTALIAAEQAVPTVNSWADYRARLKLQGKSPAEIDAKVASLLAAMKTMDRTIGNDRIGMAAPAFEFDGWLNSKPLAIEDLRGSVVLLRWWTDTCPMCASTSPALRKFHEQYSAKGLKVIGVFHPKFGREKPIDVERLPHAVVSRQYLFPVAIDWNWRTLNDWWLNSRPEGVRVPTSVTSFWTGRVSCASFIPVWNITMERHQKSTPPVRTTSMLFVRPSNGSCPSNLLRKETL